VASAKKDGQRLISVLLGASGTESRAQESQKLLTYGMRFFETHQLYDAQEVVAQARVWGGAEDHLELLIADDLAVTIPRGQAKYIKAEMTINKGIEAPVMVGQNLGRLEIRLDGELIIERQLVASVNVSEGGFIKSISDSVARMFSDE